MAKNSSKKLFYYFLTCHLLIWTLVPYFSNSNLPRDTIEALAWGSNLDWGFDKHPPLSAFAAEFFYQLFGKNDWAYYLLSQIFVIIAFAVVYKFSEEIFNNKKFALLSVLLLEGIIFYNFTTPEFNVNIAQLPFWSLAVYYTWRCIKYDKISDYVFLGLFAGLGILSKYLFVYLIVGIKLVFLYFLKKGIKFSHYFIAGPITLLVLLPHIIWLADNNFVTITYGLHRSSGDFYTGDSILLNHIKYPFVFLLKQIVLLIPFFLMLSFIISKFKIKLNLKDKKMVFLFIINFFPILLIFLTSLFFGINIRTMWMTPFYLFFGVWIIYIFQKKINLKKIKVFYFLFITFFLISPIFYSLNSIINKDQRIDYPAKEITYQVQNKWSRNFNNNINYVVGQAWWAGNLSYNLDSRPKYIRGYLNFINKKFKPNDGVVYIEDKDSKLTKSCPGVSFTIHTRYICMVGTK